MTDLVDEALGSMTIERSWYASVRASSPWAFEAAGSSVARLVVVTSGECLLTSPVLPEPMRLTVGDSVIVLPDVEFVLRDSLTSEPVDCNGFMFDGKMRASLDGGGAVTEMHTGRFSLGTGSADPLMGSLPPIARIHLDDEVDSSVRSVLALMSMETSGDLLGSRTVSGRLADILFVQVLRAWHAADQDPGPGWLAAVRTPELVPALRALHGDLARPWTVAELASVASMSRSHFSAAFKTATGQSPLAYLTLWRVYRAKTLLRDTSMSILDVSVAVGYGSDTALYRAFKRAGHVSPGAWRRLQQDSRSVA